MKPGVRTGGRAAVRAYRRVGVRASSRTERGVVAVGALAFCLVVGGAAPARAQVAVQGSAVASLAEHRVDAGHGVEKASGTLFGGEARLFVGSRVELFVHAAGGQLTADSANAEDRDVAEGEVRLSVVTVPWLALHAGFSARSFATDLARQRWTAARFGGEVRLDFVGGGITGILRGEILPSVSVSGLDRPSHAYAAGAGLEWRLGVVALGLRYDFERYDFPAAAGVARREQFSTLTAQAGVRLRRRQRSG